VPFAIAGRQFFGVPGAQKEGWTRSLNRLLSHVNMDRLPVAAGGRERRSASRRVGLNGFGRGRPGMGCESPGVGLPTGALRPACQRPAIRPVGSGRRRPSARCRMRLGVGGRDGEPARRPGSRTGRGEALIRIARARTPSGDFRVGDMFALPFADASFDVAASFNGIWKGGEEALSELRRVLTDTGRLGLTFWGDLDRVGLMP